MIERSRTKLLKRIYKNETALFVYEEYIDYDNVRKIRTYLILNDALNTKIKLEELGSWKEEIIVELEQNGYKSIYEESVKKLLKK